MPSEKVPASAVGDRLPVGSTRQSRLAATRTKRETPGWHGANRGFESRVGSLEGGRDRHRVPRTYWNTGTLRNCWAPNRQLKMARSSPSNCWSSPLPMGAA